MARLTSMVWLLIGMLALAGCAGADQVRGSPVELGRLEQQATQAYAAGHYTQALTAYQQLAARVPGQAEVWFRLGNVQTRLEQLDQAADAYLHALALDPHDAKAMHNLGVVRLRQAEAAFAQSANSAGRAQPSLRGQSTRMADGIARLVSPEATPAANGASP